MELSKLEMELFFQPSCLELKTSFSECFSFDTRGLKLIFETGNGIIQTGNGINSLTCRPLIKKKLSLY